MTSESHICEAWLSEFPYLARFRNGRKLLRIEGPVVFGIELEKFVSTEYRPRFVALCLLSQFPGFYISRELRTKKGLQLSIGYSKHERSLQEAVGIMKDTFPFLIGDGLLGEQTLIDIYRSEIQVILGISASPLAVWFSLIQLLKFFGRDADALVERARLDDYVKTLSPPSLAIFGDFYALLKRELDVAPESLEERRQANLEKGKWGILPGT